MATIYGIDAGSWKLRLAAMEGSFGRFNLRDVQEVALLPDQGGGVPLADALTALREAEPKWSEGDKIAAFPTDDAVVRLVRLPFSDRAAIEKALPAEVEAQVPYDLDDMVLVYRTLEGPKEAASRSAVYIAPKDAVRARIDALTGVQAEPRHLIVDAGALSAYADRGVQVVADVGHRRTLLAVCQGGQVLCARVVPLAGESITLAMAEALGVEPRAAEEVKHLLALPAPESSGWEGDERTETSGVPSAGPEEAARLAAERLVAAIRAELIAVEDEIGVGIDELLLAGGGSRLGGFAELLSHRLGVPVRPVVVPGGYPQDCALAVALARSGAGDLKVPDLRIGDLTFHGAADLLWTITSVATLGAATALLAGLVLFGVRFADAQARLEELEGKMVETVTAAYTDIPAERVTDGTTALALMQERSLVTTRRVDTLGFVVSGRPPMLEMLKLVSEKVPSHGEARIDVKELTIGKEALSFKAETDSYDTAAKIEAALKAEPTFSQARKSDEKKAGEALTFSVNIPLGAEEPAATEEEG